MDNSLKSLRKKYYLCYMAMIIIREIKIRDSFQAPVFEVIALNSKQSKVY